MQNEMDDEYEAAINDVLVEFKDKDPVIIAAILLGSATLLAANRTAAELHNIAEQLGELATSPLQGAAIRVDGLESGLNDLCVGLMKALEKLSG